jgi:hypothetical protein
MATDSQAGPNQSCKKRPEPEIEWRYCDRLKPGLYEGHSRSATVYFDRCFKRWVCAIQFDILDESCITVIARATWYLNLGSGTKPRANRRSKFWIAWVLANGGPPKRFDRPSHRIFEKRYAKVVIGDTTKDHRQMAVSEQQSYSFETSGSQPACCVHMFDVTRAEIPGRETLISPAQASFFEQTSASGIGDVILRRKYEVLKGGKAGLAVGPRCPFSHGK